MICQYCGSALNTGGTCLNPACPGRLVDDLLSVSKQLGQSEARGLYDHIEPAEVAINALKSRLLAAFSNTTPYLSRDVSVPVEKLEQDLEQYITLGSTGCRTIAEDVEFNRLHSKFLAAFRKAGE